MCVCISCCKGHISEREALAHEKLQAAEKMAEEMLLRQQLSFVENLQDRTVSFSGFECRQFMSVPEEGNLEVSKQAMEEAAPRSQKYNQEIRGIGVSTRSSWRCFDLTHDTEMGGMYLDVGSFKTQHPRKKEKLQTDCGRHVFLDLFMFCVRMRSPIRSSG